MYNSNRFPPRPEHQIPTMHYLRTAIATDSAMHSVQNKRDGNGKRWDILGQVRSKPGSILIILITHCANSNHLWIWWCCLVVTKQYKSCGLNRIIRLVGACRVFPQFLEGGYIFFAWAKQDVVFLRSSWVISKTAPVPLIMLNFNFIHNRTEVSFPQSYSPCNKMKKHIPN